MGVAYIQYIFFVILSLVVVMYIYCVSSNSVHNSCSDGNIITIAITIVTVVVYDVQ